MSDWKTIETAPKDGTAILTVAEGTMTDNEGNVCLTSDGTSIVSFATVPAFKSAPQVVLWGQRCFVFVAWNGDLNRSEKIKNCSDDTPVYREVGPAIVTDTIASEGHDANG